MSQSDRICRVRYAETSTVSSEKYQYDLATRPAGQPHLLFQYTEAGAGMIEFDDNPATRRLLPAGAAFLVLIPSRARFWYPPAREPWRIRYVSIILGDQLPLANEFLARHGRLLTLPSRHPLLELQRRCEAFTWRRREPIDRYALSSLAYQFLMELFRHVESPRESMETPLPLRRALKLLRDQFDSDLTLDDVCRRVGLSSTTVNRLFRENLGATVMQTLTRIRIFNARRQLLLTDKPVKALARECGFSNAVYFCRVFRRHIGVSPGVFRLTRVINDDPEDWVPPWNDPRGIQARPSGRRPRNPA